MEFVSRSQIVVPIDEMAALERAFTERARLVERENGGYVMPGEPSWQSACAAAHSLALRRSGA